MNNASSTPNDASPTGEHEESFGDDRVDDAVARLTELDRRDVHEHPEQFERAHDALRAALDDEPDPAADAGAGSA
ncbi:MAG: hypothetical protein H0U61_05325 [Nocardioidaceae bacterium]|nr:hypothetical protein [Nocardioidaceae bacterium]